MARGSGSLAGVAISDKLVDLFIHFRPIMLQDDGKRLGLHPRGQARRREDGGTTGDSGTTGGQRDNGRQRDDGRTAGRREDGGTMGGRRVDRRMAGRWEDGGTTGGRQDDGRTAGDRRQHSSYTGCNTRVSGTQREREWCCWLSVQDVA